MVGRTRKAWRQTRELEGQFIAPGGSEKAPAVADQAELTMAPVDDETGSATAPAPAPVEARPHVAKPRTPLDALPTPSNGDGGLPVGPSLHDAQEVSSELIIDGKRRYVQHAGAFIVLALLHAFGMYRHVERLRQSAIAEGDADQRYLGKTALRVAFDAAIIALVIGQQCIEGVRRVATPSATTLLRVVTKVPSESWVRGVLARFATARGPTLHLATSFALIDEAERQHDARAWYYVDNHMRPYTGKHVVRKGWRMQDKRVRPGTSDYWVHDCDGRPLLRVNSPSHEPMTERLRPIAHLLRDALDASRRRAARS
jgi:hypothetical protein